MGRRHSARQPYGLLWLLVALVFMGAAGGAVVWWVVRPTPIVNAYAQAHSCPALVRGSNAVDDYADAFFWGGASYQLVPNRVLSVPRLGPQITTVDCNINELTAAQDVRVDPAADWPDRTATGLPSGTPVYLIDQVAPTCQLAVKVEGQVEVYAPRDREGRPLC
jgi:hypothetical protein